MLDLVIQGKSALSALNVLGAVLLWGIICVVLGFAGLFIVPRDRQRPLWRGIFGATLFCGVGLLALPPAIFLYRTLSRKTERFAFHFDLTKGVSFASLDAAHCNAVSYSQSHSMTNCIFEGDIALDLSSAKEHFRFDHSRAFWVMGEKEKASSLGFLSEPYTFEQVAEKTAALLAQWNAPSAKLDEWKAAGAAAGELIHPTFGPPEGSGLPRMQVIVKKIENPAYAQTPWFMRINMSWGDSDLPTPAGED